MQKPGFVGLGVMDLCPLPSDASVPSPQGALGLLGALGLFLAGLGFLH